MNVCETIYYVCYYIVFKFTLLNIFRMAVLINFHSKFKFYFENLRLKIWHRNIRCKSIYVMYAIARKMKQQKKIV